MENTECSTGIEYLDSLLGGLLIGDNVVWETDAGAYVELFLEKFEHHSLNAGHNLIYVSFNRSPTTMSERLSVLPNPRNITLLDGWIVNNRYLDSLRQSPTPPVS